MVGSAHDLGGFLRRPEMMAAGVFVAISAVLCVAAALAVLGAAQVQLSGAAAIEHDGLAPGRPAPRWSLPDVAGIQRTSPPARPLQLVIFADHSLKSFPSVLDGLRALREAEPGLEMVVLLRQRNDLAEPMLALLGLAGVPVLTGTPALYADYNVRVGPFAIFVDSAGQVRASSLVNHDWQVAKLRQLADVPVDPQQPGGSRRLLRRQPRPAV
jgi:hypothetical protein